MKRGRELPVSSASLPEAKRLCSGLGPAVDIQPGGYRPSLSDVQSLLLRIFTEEYGQNQKWVCVRAMHALKRAIVVMIPCLDSQTVLEHERDSPLLTGLVAGPRSGTKMRGALPPSQPGGGCPFVQAMLVASGKPSVKAAKGKAAKKVEKAEPEVGSSGVLPIRSYLATKHELDCNEYPDESGLGWVEPRELRCSNADGNKDQTKAKDGVQQSKPDDIANSQKPADASGAAEDDGWTQVPIRKRARTDVRQDKDRHLLLAVDCEMVKTATGLQLARVAVVDADLKVRYDELVKPEEEVIDYLTPFSGITKDMLADVKTSLKDVQTALLRFITKETILVGHSLECDLRALQMRHGNIIDTALLYPHPGGWPYKQSLKRLVFQHLKRELDRTSGHDPAADARAAMELALLKAEKGPGFGGQAGSGAVGLGSLLATTKTQLTLIDRAQDIGPETHWRLQSCQIHAATSDEEAVQKVLGTQKVQDGPKTVSICVLRDFHALCQCHVESDVRPKADIAQCLRSLDNNLAAIARTVDMETLLVVVSVSGDAERYTRLKKQQEDGGKTTQKLERELQLAKERAQNPFGVFAVGGEGLKFAESARMTSR